MPLPISPGTKEFAFDFLQMVVSWNEVETQAKNILLIMSRGGIGTRAAVISLGNVALANAILATAEYMPEEARKHLEHFVECLNRERGYRNHYVHSINGVGLVVGQNTGIGLLSSEDAKPRLRHHQSHLYGAELQQYCQRLDALRVYGLLINNKLYQKFNPARVSDKAKQEPWPEKPPLPDNLKKLRTHLPGLEPRPQASEG